MDSNFNLKAVITRNQKFTGTCFYSFEYFYRLWENDKDFLYISKYNILKKDFLNLKYNLNQEVFKNIIIAEPYNFNYKVSLFFDTHCFDDDILKSKNSFVISNSEKIFKKSKVFSEFFCNKNYVFKHYFNIYNKFKNKKNYTYINSMDRNFTIYNIIKKYKPYILKDLSISKTFEKTAFSGDIFKEFNKYLYIKTPNTFDRNPRMFSECAYQGIPCEYINLGGSIDPSFHRFNDRLDFEKRNILKDTIIDDILSI